MKTVDIITMGCSKNLVDSERVIKMFGETGFAVRHNPEHVGADEVIINTCGFIGDAKEESIEMILDCVRAKEEGQIGRISVMGCLSQRYRDELKAEIPEVDRWYGKFDWTGIASDIARSHPATAKWDRVITTPRHHAYLKISEGCNRFCAFCAIPLITGRHKSRSIDEICDEVRSLVSRGVKEFNVIAQDLSSYGTDLYGRQRLADLVNAIADIEGVEWIRLHYAYPADFPYDILPVMASRHNVCKYLDIALQHASDRVLSNMRRHITLAQTRELLERIRREVTGIHIRTTLMTGFPGEGEQEFQELMDFVREQRFERMGAFAYCEEDDTYGARNYEDNIPQEVKQQRLDRLMALQEEIALELNESKVGKTLRVICDGENDTHYVCRSEFDSPEVDPEVLVEKSACSEPLEKGEFYDVLTTGALPFDLFAVPAGDGEQK